jgi:thioredoxin reductase
MADRRFDVIIVGGGPAGMAAAVSAARATSSILLIDESRALGGQIWRADVNGSRPSAAGPHVEAMKDWPGTLMRETTVVDAWTGGAVHHLVINHGGMAATVTTANLILATGARELFLPFPGWTVPGVTGVGGLQALVKGGLDIRGKRVVVAGSGPLIVAVAASLKRHGASIAGLFEQTTRMAAAAFAASMISSPARLKEAADYMVTLSPATLSMNAWVERALGLDRLEAVDVRDGRKTRRIECDYAAVAYGLVPNTELARLLHVEWTKTGISADAQQATNIPGVFAAGDCTGIAGSETALAEGSVAGKVATGQGTAAEEQRAVEWGRGYATRMAEAFAPRREVLELSDADTLICRCEDIRLGQLDAGWDARAAKLYTRCGMGACQGRVCGAALQALRNWPLDTIRPPLQPAPASVFFSTTPDSHGA